jgi:hypothetical protein
MSIKKTRVNSINNSSADIRQLNFGAPTVKKSLRLISNLAKNALDVSHAEIYLIDRERQWFKSTLSVDICQSTKHNRFCEQTLLEDAPFIIEDTLKNKRVKNLIKKENSNTRFFVGIPIKSMKGFQIGVLCIFDNRR